MLPKENDLPLKSIVNFRILVKKQGLMHACGHDTHTAIRRGVAENPGQAIKDKIKGNA